MTAYLSVNSAQDKVMAGLIAGLDSEFGEGGGEQLAELFWDAEACDFLWEARLCERWLGSLEHEDPAGDGEDVTYDRVVIMAMHGGSWIVAVVLIDGDGIPHVLLGQRHFDSKVLAAQAYAATG